MGILETYQLDGITLCGNSGDEVRLVVFDHLSWDNPEEHARMLQEKLNAYVAFVESGRIFDVVRASVKKGVRIAVVLKAIHLPRTLSAQQSLSAVADFVAGFGLGFVVERDLRRSTRKPPVKLPSLLSDRLASLPARSLCNVSLRSRSYALVIPRPQRRSARKARAPEAKRATTRGCGNHQAMTRSPARLEAPLLI
jgi:hypothetical protein